MDQPEMIQVPDIAVRQIGALSLQLAVAEQRIRELEAELSALKATKPDGSKAPAKMSS